MASQGEPTPPRPPLPSRSRRPSCSLTGARSRAPARRALAWTLPRRRLWRAAVGCDEAERSAEGSSKGGATVNPVVFSRKETFCGPDEEEEGQGQGGGGGAEQQEQQEHVPSAAAAALMHQSDANGNQQRVVPAPTNAPNSPHASRARRIGSGAGGGDGEEEDEEEHEQRAKQDGAKPGLLSKLCCCLYIGGGGGGGGGDGGGGSQAGGSRGGGGGGGARQQYLLPPLAPEMAHKPCLVLDLDETLVHSSFKPTKNPDYIIPVVIEGTTHKVYVAKRPGVDEFMRKMGEVYEVVIYTASLSKYADPLLDLLDIHNVISHRLFREHCVNHEGGYVKDLSLLGRPIQTTIIVDNSPLSYLFHPQNAIGCGTFIDDMSDVEMPQMVDFLLQTLGVRDVRDHMYKWAEWDGESRLEGLDS